jgi:uncharacterized alkaline shock family protein YloU
MAMNQTDDYTLPCGRDVETVWDRLGEVEAGRADAHELDCAHCLAARESLLVLRQLTGELAVEDVEPSFDLTSRIMSAVRAEVRRRDTIPLPTPEPGEVLVSEQAVAAVLRFAADSVDGVRARHCRITVETTADGAVECVVDLTVAVAYRRFAADALPVVRDRVTAAASARIGLRLARLNLTVVDVYDA